MNENSFEILLSLEISDLYFQMEKEKLKAEIERLKKSMPPNDPLTLEELREMDWEPVWISFCVPYGDTAGMWVLVSVDEYTGEVFLTNGRGERYAYEEVIVDIEAIYRRKPEEGTP